DLLRDRVGVVGGQVGRPGRRSVGRAELRAEAGHDLAMAMSDGVTAHLRSAGLDIPAEKRLVEGDRLRYVVDADIHPARRTGRPPRIARNHFGFPPLDGSLRPTLTQGQRDRPANAQLFTLGIHVRQDQPQCGAPHAAAEADLRDRRGSGDRGLRRPGRLGCGGARLVRGIGARLREPHRAELHRGGYPALLRGAGAVVLPGLVPVCGPGLAAGPAAVRAGRPGSFRGPQRRGVEVTGPATPTTSPSTVTLARLTRCTTARIARQGTRSAAYPARGLREKGRLRA